MRQWWAQKRISIRSKLFGAMVLISLVPLTLFTAVVLYFNYTELHAQLISSRENSMAWLGSRLEISIKNYTDMFYEYEVDREYKNSIAKWVNGAGLTHTDIDRMRSMFETTLNMSTDIRSIEVYNLHTDEGYVATRASFYPVQHATGKNVWDSRETALQTNVMFLRDGDEIIALHRMNQFETDTPLVMMVARLSPRAFSDVLEQLSAETEESVFLLNDEQQILLDTGHELNNPDAALAAVWAGLEEGKTYTEDGVFYFYERAGRGKLQVVYMVPNSLLLHALQQTLLSGLVFAALAVLASVMLSAVLSRRIAKPIVDLSGQMKTVSVLEGFRGGTEPGRYDEIGDLEQSFNGMILRNQELIASEYQTTLEKRNAQIRALQAQINPHFMNNTLQVIGGMSIKNKVPEIYSVVIALSDIMRYSYSFADEMVPLSEELQYLGSYLSIQNERFSQRVHLSLDVPAELNSAQIPKLILQPILENSFEHGLQEKTGDWNISLTAKEQNGALILRVQDNGLGMSAEKLAELRETMQGESGVLAKSSHIGLGNVHARVRLKFGEEYGVEVESVPGAGTTVTIYTKLLWEAGHELPGGTD